MPKPRVLEKYEVDESRCILCGICVDACPYDALRCGPDFELAHESRQEPMIDLLAISAILAGSSLSAAETGKAELTGVKGSVKVDGQTAFVGEAVKPGQKVETGAGAQANLYLADNGPTVVVLPDSSISFEELSVDKTGAEPVITTKINLKGGTVAGYVKKTSSQSSYIVKGSTVTAVIRTSEYQVTDNGTVAVFSGCVTVSYRGASYDVCGGQMFDPSAASVVANTFVAPAGMPSGMQQSLSAKVSVPAPTVAPRPTPAPANFVQTFVVKNDVLNAEGQVVLKAGTVLPRSDFDQAVSKYGADKVSGAQVPVGGLIVVQDPLQVPSLKKGDVIDQATFDNLVKQYGDKAFVAVKVDPTFQVTNDGIVPKKPEVVSSPTRP